MAPEAAASAGKYIAAPWQVRDSYTAEGRRMVIANIDGEYIDGVPHNTYDVVAICEDDFGEHLPSAEANARLIAAAPDLLEALREMRDAAVYQTACQAADSEAVNKLADEKLVTALAKTRAAIAQAEGRDQ